MHGPVISFARVRVRARRHAHIVGVEAAVVAGQPHWSGSPGGALMSSDATAGVKTCVAQVDYESLQQHSLIAG